MDPLADGRYEIKRVVPDTELPVVLAWLRLHHLGFSEAFPPRWVNNVYFDTEQLSSVGDNLAGIGRRVKMRLRWYGLPRTVDRGVVEFKCKQDLLGWKVAHRVSGTIDLCSVTWRDVTDRIGADLPESARHSVWFARRPVLINRYHRRYQVSWDGRIRATVDTDVAVHSQWMSMRPNLTRAVPGQRRIVLELKAASADHERLAQASNGMPGGVGKHSKYLAGIYGLSA